MNAFDEVVLVNYCYPDCVPLMNIMRLPKEEAFRLAEEFASKYPDTTAFYRFADFDNYYALRESQDAYLYAKFIELGGLPEEEHPLSFAVGGSDYLGDWFGGGIKTVLPLKEVLPCHISFTLGDSGAAFQKYGEVELFNLEGFCGLFDEYNGDFAALLSHTGYHYIEAQLWSDKYVR